MKRAGFILLQLLGTGDHSSGNSVHRVFVNVPDQKIWLTNPPPADFLRWEGAIVLPTDPIIRVDLISSSGNGPAKATETDARADLRFTTIDRCS